MDKLNINSVLNYITKNIASLGFIMWRYLWSFYKEVSAVYEGIWATLEDFYVWYVNLEIKLDIVEDYYNNVQDIITCNIVIK